MTIFFAEGPYRLVNKQSRAVGDRGKPEIFLHPLSRRPTQAFPQVRIVLQALQGKRNFFRLILSNHQATRLLAIRQNVGKPVHRWQRWGGCHRLQRCDRHAFDAGRRDVGIRRRR